MLKYKTQGFFDTRIDAVECERETDVSVFVGGRRNAKRSQYDNYFDTWEEAHSFLLKKADNEVIAARNTLQRMNARLGNIKGMKKPCG